MIVFVPRIFDALEIRVDRTELEGVFGRISKTDRILIP